MAKANGSIKYEHNDRDIRYEFFPAQRRKVILEKLTANEKDNNPNLIYQFRMPITGEAFLGFPAFLGTAYEAVNKEGSLVSEAPLGDFELPGLTIEFFRTAEHKKRMLGLVNKSLFKFIVQKEKDGDSFITVLRFKIRVEETKARLLFWHDLRGIPMYAKFTPCADAVKEADDSQMSFEEAAGKQHTDTGDDDMPRQDPERAKAVAEG
jgi:hypothetical protein